MNYPKTIILHHSAVSREKNANQFVAIDNYHRSKGWGKVGYHYVLEPDGTIKHGRAENEVGAHCKEAMMNYRSIGVCMTGNFDIELPTIKQMESLEGLCRDLCLRHGIKPRDIVGHRKYATYKSCPGNKFTDEMIYDVQRKMETKGYDMKLTTRLEGKLLLQVQDRGKLWLVLNGRRFYLGTSFNEYEAFMDEVRKGKVPILGITNDDINKIPL